MRKIVAQMQKEFEDLSRENASLPPAQRLDPADLVVDPEYANMLEEQGEQLVEEVRRECQYDSEKAAKALAKLREKYLNDVEVEGMRMSALRSAHVVASFRTARLSGALKEMLDKVHAMMRGEEPRTCAPRRTPSAGRARRRRRRRGRRRRRRRRRRRGRRRGRRRRRRRGRRRGRRQGRRSSRDARAARTGSGSARVRAGRRGRQEDLDVEARKAMRAARARSQRADSPGDDILRQFRLSRALSLSLSLSGDSYSLTTI